MEKEEKLSISIPKEFLIKLIMFIVLAGIVLGIGYLIRNRGTIAVVNGERIKRWELDRRLENIWGAETLARMIEEKLVKKEGEKEKIKLTKKEIDKKIDELIKRFGTKAKFEEMLKESNMNMDNVREQIALGIILEKLASKKISEKDLKDFYEKYKSTFFETPEQIRCRHILVNSEDEAKDILRRLKKGEDFVTLAKEKSTDPGTKDKGGDLGFFRRGQMDPEFDKVAWSLKEGEISNPVKTRFGYHIIKMEGKTARKMSTFEESKEKVKSMVSSEKIEEVVKNLKEKAKIKNYLFSDEAMNKFLKPWEKRGAQK